MELFRRFTRRGIARVPCGNDPSKFFDVHNETVCSASAEPVGLMQCHYGRSGCALDKKLVWPDYLDPLAAHVWHIDVPFLAPNVADVPHALPYQANPHQPRSANRFNYNQSKSTILKSNFDRHSLRQFSGIYQEDQWPVYSEYPLWCPALSPLDNMAGEQRLLVLAIEPVPHVVIVTEPVSASKRGGSV